MKKTLPILAMPALLLLAPSAQAGEPRVLFPTPFVVEHHATRSGPGGEEFVSETVTDTYGGAFLVSVHPSGLRTVVDFARREITEVDPAKGSYWTLGFGRMRELRDRIARASRSDLASRAKPQAGAPAAIHVEEVASAGEAQPQGVAARLGTRHLRAASEGSPALDVWCDPGTRIGVEGLDALRAFETETLGGDPAAGRSPGELLDAVRRQAAGGFPVRTRRALSLRGDDQEFMEDIVTRLEPIPALAEKLVTIGPGFRRIPSPLEIVAAFEDEEEARRTGTAR